MTIKAQHIHKIFSEVLPIGFSNTHYAFGQHNKRVKSPYGHFYVGGSEWFQSKLVSFWIGQEAAENAEHKNDQVLQGQLTGEMDSN